MSCNSCAKPFSLLRKEKGCPGCGFSYCSKCLENKVFVPKLNAEAKVCAKCKQSPSSSENKKILPPDAYYKRMEASCSNILNSTSYNPKDQEILDRLQKLKKETKSIAEKGTDESIAKRLQVIKGDVPSVSDDELQTRLNKLRGQPTNLGQNKNVLPAPDTRTDQEQVNDLLKQYMEQSKIDSSYKDEFIDVINIIESRMQRLKGTSEENKPTIPKSQDNVESEDEEETIQKIIEKVKAESFLEENASSETKSDELPFCEICNEDANMRCLGCKYLFCQRCFLEHKDDDDGCNRYELYKPPSNS